jgi:hypothetical protein
MFFTCRYWNFQPPPKLTIIINGYHLCTIQWFILQDNSTSLPYEEHAIFFFKYNLPSPHDDFHNCIKSYQVSHEITQIILFEVLTNICILSYYGLASSLSLSLSLSYIYIELNVGERNIEKYLACMGSCEDSSCMLRFLKSQVSIYISNQLIIWVLSYDDGASISYSSS